MLLARADISDIPLAGCLSGELSNNNDDSNSNNVNNINSTVSNGNKTQCQ